MEPSDADLLAAIRRGDSAAVDRLLERYEPRIYRFGLRLCGDEDTAREVLQETLLAAFRHLPGFRGEASLSTWLYQIARSVCIKQRRHDHPTAPLEADDHAAPAVGAPDASLHARQIGAALAAGMAALSPEYREALVLRDVEGLSADEAAAVTGVEVGAHKSRLHRARLELRQHLFTLLGEGEREEAGLEGPTPCPELAQALAGYVTADIDQSACEAIEAHLSRCPRCKGACEALSRTVSLCRRLPAGEVPAPVRAAVRQALRHVLPAT